MADLCRGRQGWNKISKATLNAVLDTDIGQAALAAAETRGRLDGMEKGRHAEARRIYLALCETLPEAEARRIVGYKES